RSSVTWLSRAVLPPPPPSPLFPYTTLFRSLGGVPGTREISARLDQRGRLAAERPDVAGPLFQRLSELLERAGPISHQELSPSPLGGRGPAGRVQRRLGELLVEGGTRLGKIGALASGP